MVYRLHACRLVEGGYATDPQNCFCHARCTLDSETAVPPGVDSVCDKLRHMDIAFDDLHVAGVSIPAEITLEGYIDADEDLKLCVELTDDEVVRKVTENSKDSDTEIKRQHLHSERTWS